MSGGLTERALTAAARPLLWRLGWLGGVAALAGVSVGTASKALNTRSGRGR